MPSCREAKMARKHGLAGRWSRTYKSYRLSWRDCPRRLNCVVRQHKLKEHAACRSSKSRSHLPARRSYPWSRSGLWRDLGLKDAKHLSDYLHDNALCVLVAGVDREVADHAAGLLPESGTEVVVEESSIEVPMLLCPEANQRYRWSWLGGPTPV